MTGGEAQPELGFLPCTFSRPRRPMAAGQDCQRSGVSVQAPRARPLAFATTTHHGVMLGVAKHLRRAERGPRETEAGLVCRRRRGSPCGCPRAATRAAPTGVKRALPARIFASAVAGRLYGCRTYAPAFRNKNCLRQGSCPAFGPLARGTFNGSR